MKKIFIALVFSLIGIFIGCESEEAKKSGDSRFKIVSASVEFKDSVESSYKIKESSLINKEESGDSTTSTGVYAEYVTWETWTFSSEYDTYKWNDVVYEDKTPVVSSTQATMITGVARTIITTYTLDGTLYYNDNTGKYTDVGFIPSQELILDEGNIYTHFIVEGTVHLSDGSTITSSYTGTVLIATVETYRNHTSLFDELIVRYAGKPVVDDGRDQLTLSVEIDPSLIKK